jgi:hypothetical protein
MAGKPKAPPTGCWWVHQTADGICLTNEGVIMTQAELEVLSEEMKRFFTAHPPLDIYEMNRETTLPSRKGRL